MSFFYYFSFVLVIASVNAQDWRCHPNEHYIAEGGNVCLDGLCTEQGALMFRCGESSPKTQCLCDDGYFRHYVTKRCVLEQSCPLNATCSDRPCKNDVNHTPQTCFDTSTGTICRDSGCSMMRCTYRCVDAPENSFCVIRGNRSESCFEQSDKGPCEAIYRRFFYNPVYAACQPFVYGGCSGNGNNFETIHQCMQSCYSETDHQ